VGEEDSARMLCSHGLQKPELACEAEPSDEGGILQYQQEEGQEDRSAWRLTCFLLPTSFFRSLGKDMKNH
jgi:hypothetical protein